MPSWKDKLLRRAPERIRRMVEEGVPNASFDPEDPPVNVGDEPAYPAPSWKDIEYDVPEEAKHRQHVEQLEYNVGDPVEFDPGPDHMVSAVHVVGPPMQPPRRNPPKQRKDEDDAAYTSRLDEWHDKDAERKAAWVDEMTATYAHYPFRDLQPGAAIVRSGAIGRIIGIARGTVVVAVAPYAVAINDDLFEPRELKHLDHLHDTTGMYAFGFSKDNLIPLKLEDERRWAHVPCGTDTRSESAPSRSRTNTTLIVAAEEAATPHKETPARSCLRRHPGGLRRGGSDL